MEKTHVRGRSSIRVDTFFLPDYGHAIRSCYHHLSAVWVETKVAADKSALFTVILFTDCDLGLFSVPAPPSRLRAAGFFRFIRQRYHPSMWNCDGHLASWRTAAFSLEMDLSRPNRGISEWT
ncbi:MAG: hypothetical protein KDA55_12675, partial [Planctomycetales bacterium]|nr:hypothetical protein [Planctomycetales bacterium]